ncbi:hypothetical protein C8F04DRAFT_1142867 [Mycena alexandri]|uniref:Uncharacterized protein n=1 Tax=Mycena alexandri TaxID=1745969 RepID=A0AAD6S5X3_9AGAR|nr:hypothetical protein C8F04DRAFT_1142867 [Mycena alexandri]
MSLPIPLPPLFMSFPSLLRLRTPTRCCTCVTLNTNYVLKNQGFGNLMGLNGLNGLKHSKRRGKVVQIKFTLEFKTQSSVILP